MTIGELEGAVLPDLAGELTETLCAYWLREGDSTKSGTASPAMLYTLLDSLLSATMEREDA